jgi:hypothetical protein
MITPHQLSPYLGKSIAQICQNGYTSDAENHCAHFVAHALDYRFGLTCLVLGTPRGAAATTRVEDLLLRCARVGVWALRPASLTTCLVFMTGASNINLAVKGIANVQRRRVGIFVGGFVWHYSNTQQQVVRQMPTQFSQYYPAPDNAMFYGSLP